MPLLVREVVRQDSRLWDGWVAVVLLVVSLLGKRSTLSSQFYSSFSLMAYSLREKGVFSWFFVDFGVLTVEFVNNLDGSGI